MELTDEIAHRALAYVAAVQRQGYVMTVEEFEAYIHQPDPLPATPGTPGRMVRTTRFDRAVRGPNLDRTVRTLQQLQREFIVPTLRGVERALDVREAWIPGTPGTPGESVAEWLARLRWLRVQDGRVRTTPLGDAMLGHLEQASLEDEIPVGVVLDQDDRLATARVMQQIADVGPCAVVDRYFSMDSLLPILYSTEVEAVLMGDDAGGKLAGVETALRSLTVDRPFEVRKSGVFHDRFVIPPHGPVWALGTSLTGLGRRLSIMVRIDDEKMSDAIRREFRDAWDAADVVAAQQPEPMPEPSADEEPAEATEPDEAGEPASEDADA